jgi:hypothetical protein
MSSTSGLKVDYSTGYVGIGTTTPQAKLDVRDTLYCPGSVVQIQFNSYSGNASTTSTPFIDIDTNFGVTITPRFVNSQILINGMLHVGGNPNTDSRYTFFRLARYINGSATEIGNGTTSGTSGIGMPCIACHNWGAAAEYGNEVANVFIQYVDTPSSTSPITYRFRWSANPGSSGSRIAYMNRTSVHDDGYRPNTISTISVMEICQ